MFSTAWHRVKRENPALRKALSLSKQVPRSYARVARREPAYSLLANSFPKSGTHLLVQILEAIPDITNFDSFIAQYPPIRFQKRSDTTIARRIAQIAPGELVSAHLHYNATYCEHLAKRRCIPFLIYRDLRDVVVSEVHYLTHMNRWHRAHRYFAELPDDDARLTAAISGIPAEHVSYSFPDIGARFRPFLGWLRAPQAFCVKYEDLVGPNKEQTVLSILEFVRTHGSPHLEPKRAVRQVLANIDPHRSRTFRAGGSGAWKDAFDSHHVDAMKAAAGDLLTELGYTQDCNW